MSANKSVIWDLINSTRYEETKEAFCNYCDQPVSNNITRFKQHATKCAKIPLSEKIRCIKNFIVPITISTENLSVESNLDGSLVASTSQSSLISPNSSVSQFLFNPSSPFPIKQNRKRPFDKKINHHFDQIDKQTQENANQNLAKFFFKNAMAFKLISDPYLMKFCKILRPSFNLPSVHQLKTTHLTREFEEAKRSMDQAIEESVGVTIVIDGWSNVRRDDIVNIILCTPKPFFYSSTNTKDKSKTAVYLKTG